MKPVWLLVFKVFIALFWIVALSILLYGMIFQSSRSFLILLKEGLWIIVCIFLLGIISIICERYIKNIAILYFLLCYFSLPIMYSIIAFYELFTESSMTLSIIQIAIYCGFFIFSILSIVGFISCMKRGYEICKICLISCICFYILFLPFSAIVLGWLDKDSTKIECDNTTYTKYCKPIH